MIFSNIGTDFNLIFGQFYVARKLILNGGAIRLTGLLFHYSATSEVTLIVIYPIDRYDFVCIIHQSCVITNYHACIAIPT